MRRSGGRVLLGDKTGIETVMQRPIRFQCVGACIATGLSYTYKYTTAQQIYTEFRAAPDTPTVRVNYCQGSRVSVPKYPSRTVIRGSKAARIVILTKDFRRFPQYIQQKIEIMYRFGHNHFVQNSNSSILPPSTLYDHILTASLNKQHTGLSDVYVTVHRVKIPYNKTN